MFVDSHCHLDFPGLAEREDEILATMAANDVGTALCISVRLEEFPRVLALAERHAHLWASVGVHPDNADCEEPDLARLLALADHPRVVAIGETGLDYYRDRASEQAQVRAFEAQIGIARRSGLPLVIHVRDAAGPGSGRAVADCYELLAAEAEGIEVILHCFSATPERAEEAAGRGWHVSFAGNVTYPRSGELREAAALVPDRLLLVETDSPYLAPQPVRGRSNSPANVTHTAEVVAEARGIGYERLDAIVTGNAARLFRWSG